MVCTQDRGGHSCWPLSRRFCGGGKMASLHCRSVYNLSMGGVVAAVLLGVLCQALLLPGWFLNITSTAKTVELSRVDHTLAFTPTIRN